ncbi:hypothetical protein V7S52_11850, partial [Agromyces sp. CCNWLW208]
TGWLVGVGPAPLSACRHPPARRRAATGGVCNLPGADLALTWDSLGNSTWARTPLPDLRRWRPGGAWREDFV